MHNLNPFTIEFVAVKTRDFITVMVRLRYYNFRAQKIPCQKTPVEGSQSMLSTQITCMVFQLVKHHVIGPK